MKDTLRDLRTQNGLTAAQAAEFLNVKQSAVSNYEAGTRSVSLEQVLILAEHYGTTAEVIINAQLNSISVRKPNKIVGGNVKK